jgi:hypothetical protein
MAVEPDIQRISAEIRAEVSASWTADGEALVAAVVAHSHRSLDLLAIASPPSLLERTHRAAILAGRAAEVCFALASAYSGVPIKPSRAPHTVVQYGDRARIAAEARCLARAAAQSLSHAQYARARMADEGLRGALSLRIASAEHEVELANELLAFCEAQASA